MPKLLKLTPISLTLMLAAIVYGYSQIAHAISIGVTDDVNPGMAIFKASNQILTLQARDMPIPNILRTLVSKARIKLHYSQLPTGLVTINCSGDLKKVLECLLAGKADLVVRYPNTINRERVFQQIAEAWVLVPSNDNHQTAHPDKSSIQSESIQKHTSSAGQISAIAARTNQAETDPSRTFQWLKRAQLSNPTVRAEAIGDLLADDHIQNDPSVKAVLEQALNDQDPEVRAQAISSYAHRAGVDATQALQHALQDSSADVRLMAVDSITNDVTLLQQAINDNDENVRTLATVKLNQLNQNQEANQLNP